MSEQDVPEQEISPEKNAYTKPTLALREVWSYTSNVTGKVKTIIDASIADPKQNKAVKDLVHTAIWNAYEEVRDWSYRAVTDPEQAEYFPFGHGSMPSES